MLRLIEPCEQYLASYKAAYREYGEYNVTTYSFDDSDSCDIFAKYENYRHARNLKPDRVGSDYYWLVEDERDHFIGEITIRHCLNDALLQCGGHIGYGVRCSEWGRGYGTRMLELALEKARQRGLEKVLITCDDNNTASARVIEHNGFTLEDKRAVNGAQIRRYWKTLG